MRIHCLKKQQIKLRWLFLLILMGSNYLPSAAQTVELSIRETLQRVEQQLPLLESYRQQAAATKENGAIVRNSLVPDLNIGYQANIATFNNITGMNYPGFLLPISGPPSLGNDWNFIPGSAAGALLKWNPITFGQRQAALEKASAQFKLANANYNEQLFHQQYLAIQHYLEAIYLQKTLRIARAVVDRLKLNLSYSLVLTQTGLKAGIDSAQFQAAILQAEIEELQTEKNYLEKLTELSRLTGLETTISSLVLTDTIPGISLQALEPVEHQQHPLFKALQSQKAITAAGLKEQKKAWLPQLDIWGNLYARGSGVDATGVVDKGAGWQFSRTNAGVGLQLSFSILQFSKINIRKKQFEFLLKSDEARLSQAQLDISKQTEQAMMHYQKNVAIAAKTPKQLRIANEVYEGLKISYEAGLIDYTRLYQAQYELIRAELSNANAQMQVWSSLLSIAIAKGNLSLFLDSLN
jgi:outer membrane protein TolC